MSRLFLVYYQPVTDIPPGSISTLVRQEGFHMDFNTKVVEIDLDLERIVPLLQQARAILDQQTAPPGRPECEDCARVDTLLGLLE